MELPTFDVESYINNIFSAGKTAVITKYPLNTFEVESRTGLRLQEQL